MEAKNDEIEKGRDGENERLEQRYRGKEKSREGKNRQDNTDMSQTQNRRAVN